MKERNYQNYKRLTKEQMPRVRKLVRQCCNYDHGACIALDDGAGCECVQAISYSLLCKWFRSAVLPLDPVLELSLLGGTPKRCENCKELSSPAPTGRSIARPAARSIREPWTQPSTGGITPKGRRHKAWFRRQNEHVGNLPI